MINLNEIIVKFVLYSVIGTILHFTYKLSKKNIVVGIFSQTNESVWEHIKMLLTPIFFLNTISYLINRNNIVFYEMFVELSSSIILIIIFYYVIKHFFGNRYEFLYVLSFYVTSFIVSYLGYQAKISNISSALNCFAMLLDIIIFLMYLSFSIFPPKNDIFKDPVTGTYGICVK